MRAVVVKELGPPESLSMEDVPAPTPGEDEVLMDLHACSINFPDLLFIEGKYQVRPDLPFSPGFDAAGVVTAAGAGIKNLKTGDRVMVRLPKGGGYAEQATSPEHLCYPMPDAMSFVDAAAMGMVYQTAYFGLLDRGQYQEGETVLVNGASGGVGTAAVQLAKALGATVLGGVSNLDKGDVVRAAGADHIIDLGADNLRDSLRDQVFVVTDGKGADVILDPIGGAVFEASMRALAWRGRIVIVGYAAGEIPSVKTNYIMIKNIIVSGLSAANYLHRTPDWMARAQQELFDLHTEGKLKPHVMKTYPLEDYLAALNVVRNREVQGKVVLTPKNET